MGIQKKQSRLIQVDEERYRWKVSRSQQALTGDISVVLELSSAPGQRLTVRVACRNFWLDVKELTENRRPFAAAAYRPVTPGMVRKIIAWALANGWQPHRKQKPLALAWTNEES